MQGMVAGKRSRGKYIIDIFGMMTTASRLTEDGHQFHKDLFSEESVITQVLLEDFTRYLLIRNMRCVFYLAVCSLQTFKKNVISPRSDSTEPGAAILAEEKIMFGVHAHAMSLMTIAKIRKVYTTTDAKSISKQLTMPARENATPIRILHNSAAHLSGSARSFGAILMGYLGEYMRCL